MNIQEIKTLGALKTKGYVSKRIKAEDFPSPTTATYKKTRNLFLRE